MTLALDLILAGAPPTPATASRGRSVLRTIELAIWTVLSAASVVLAALVVMHGMHFLRVLSPSMAPQMPVGSVAVTSRVPVEELRVGQVAVFHTPTEGVPYIHRIVSMQRTSEGLLIRTKGDANTTEDPWTLHIAESDADVLVQVLPLSRVSSALADLNFMGLPLMLIGTASTAYFGWSAMRRPEETELVTSMITGNPESNA
jgi:signal peptidase